MPAWLQQLLPILILLAAVSVVLLRLPRVELGHSAAFRRRRFFNWFPLGMTYAFLYMGRYNLNVATSAMSEHTSNADFGTIFAWGTVTYAFSFLINGPLTDKLGGRKTILIAAAGASVMNVLMGLVVWGVTAKGWSPPGGIVGSLSVLYAGNMYFQSFGAVSIVKVNSSWFHVRERGVLGGVFGILISLGLYFAYDWSRFIVNVAPVQWAFFIPAAVLLTFFVIEFFLVRDSPSKAGFEDFDTQDASSGDTGPALGVWPVFKKMITNPVMLVILGIEFCSGFLRNAVMQWYPKLAAATGDTFVSLNWGMLLCVAGIMGGMFAGVISDRVFGSRRGPVSAVLYGGMTMGSIVAIFLIGNTAALGWAVVFMSLCVIGVHGMLSGTATMDFGGRRNAGLAVGIVDGAVYLGTAVQSVVLGHLLPSGEAATVVSNWKLWPWLMLPFCILGLVLATRVWNARPTSKAAPAPAALATAEGEAATEVARTGSER